MHMFCFDESNDTKKIHSQLKRSYFNSTVLNRIDFTIPPLSMCASPTWIAGCIHSEMDKLISLVYATHVKPHTGSLNGRVYLNYILFPPRVQECDKFPMDKRFWWMSTKATNTHTDRTLVRKQSERGRRRRRRRCQTNARSDHTTFPFTTLATIMAATSVGLAISFSHYTPTRPHTHTHTTSFVPEQFFHLHSHIIIHVCMGFNFCFSAKISARLQAFEHTCSIENKHTLKHTQTHTFLARSAWPSTAFRPMQTATAPPQIHTAARFLCGKPLVPDQAAKQFRKRCPMCVRTYTNSFRLPDSATNIHATIICHSIWTTSLLFSWMGSTRWKYK